MAETLAAIGLASSIMQFVDCGIRWASRAQELYKSVDGCLKENSELEGVINDLRAMLVGLNGSLLSGEPELEALVLACSQLADELRGILRALRVDQKKSPWKESVMKGFESMRKKSQMLDIERRLFRLRDQICAHLNILLRYVGFYNKVL